MGTTTITPDDAFAAGVAYGAERSIGGILNSTLANPAEWFLDAIGGKKSSAGVRVNYKTALTIAYNFAAQQIISGDVASLPFETKRREADDDLTLDRTHPVYWVMNGDANEAMSAYLFRETITHWALMVGNGLAYILRDSMGRPSQLIPACPGDLTAHRVDGRIVYHNREMDLTFDQDEIFHLRGLGDDVGGHSLLTIAKDSWGAILAQDRSTAQNWKNGNQPKVVLKHPAQLSKEQADELLERFEARHSEQGRPALAAGGLEIESFPVTNSDAQMVEAKKQAIIEVSAWYNLPPHKLGDSSRVGYNGLAQENQAYITQTLRRWLKRWETEAARKLLPSREYRTFATVLCHNPQPLTDTDTAAITKEVSEQKAAMLITTNEGRRRLGYPRIEGGDVLENPNTTSPRTGGGQTEDVPDTTAVEPSAAIVPTTSTPIPREPFVQLLTERLDRLATTMQGVAETKRKKQQPFDADWSASWAERTSGYVSTAIDATSTAFSTMSVSEIEQVVFDWSSAVTSGDVLVPSPADLAEQIIGAAK